jgi:hypothetical protein
VKITLKVLVKLVSSLSKCGGTTSIETGEKKPSDGPLGKSGKEPGEKALIPNPSITDSCGGTIAGERKIIW